MEEKNMSEDVHIDPTAVGLLLIGFILFVVGIFGLQTGGVLKDYITGDDLMMLCAIIGIMLVIVSFFAYKAGSLFGTGVFMWVAIALLTIKFAGIDGSWFLYVIIAIFFFVFTTWAFLAGSPKILVGVLACAGLAFLFLGIGLMSDLSGDTAKIMFDLTGVFALIGFVLATYLGFALTGVKELKVA